MKHFRTSVVFLLAAIVILGGAYPLLMTGVGALFFPAQASGSLVRVGPARGGNVIGSRLIGQRFTGPEYFHPRPSVVDYNTMPSGASNLGYTSRELKTEYEKRKAEWEKENGTTTVPQTMVWASGSGLDPDISPRAAELQVPRVAAARGLDAMGEAALMALVEKSIAGPQLGFLGEPRVNVLELNLAVDKAFPR